jgi:DNA-binding NarL/FixJ family response regulator
VTTTNQIRVLTVDDHPLMRSGIAAVIEGEEDIMVVGEANNGKEAVESFRVNRPDVTLMDLQNARYERHRRHPRDPL